jgi:hypothetical protein
LTPNHLNLDVKIRIISSNVKVKSKLYEED